MWDCGSIIDALIRREGGWVNHPADAGGPTKYGITQQTLSEHRGIEVTAADVRELTEAEAREIYRRRYVEEPRFDELQDPALRELVIDCAVQHGVSRSARWLQAAAGVAADGVVGPVTLQAVNGADGGKLYRTMLGRRARFYGSILMLRSDNWHFASGWMARLSEFIEATP